MLILSAQFPQRSSSCTIEIVPLPDAHTASPLASRTASSFTPKAQTSCPTISPYEAASLWYTSARSRSKQVPMFFSIRWVPWPVRSLKLVARREVEVVAICGTQTTAYIPASSAAAPSPS